MTTSLTFIFDRKKTASVKKTGVVELLIKAFGKRKYISTGVKLHPKEWKNGSVWARDDQDELNDQLYLLKKRVGEIVTRMISEKNFDLAAIPNILKDELQTKQTFIQYAKEEFKVRAIRMCEASRKHYDSFFKFMEKWKMITYFSDVTEHNVVKLDEKLREKGFKTATRWNYQKMLKTFVLQAVRDGLIKKNPYARVKFDKSDNDGLTRFLTPTEFHNFESCLIPIQRLEKVRDLFVFQTYTMLSYADLAAFRWENCIKLDGQVVYRSRRKKTNQPFVVVLMKPALIVLKKYKNKLPIISNIKYNEYLKAAVLYAQIDKPVTTHYARHTGATLMLNEGGLPMHIVQHILGHASIKETEKTYAKVLDESIVQQMANYQKRKFG